MNEWHLQQTLEQKWTMGPLFWNDRHWHLVTRELMFPSWQINSNKKKWNEPSVDFVLFDGDLTFLILELKYEVKSPVKLLEAFCQTQHSAFRFLEGYSPEKMGQITIQPFVFPIHPKVQLLIGAKLFAKSATELMTLWNDMEAKELKELISSYKKRRVFERFPGKVGVVSFFTP